MKVSVLHDFTNICCLSALEQNAASVLTSSNCGSATTCATTATTEKPLQTPQLNVARSHGSISGHQTHTQDGIFGLLVGFVGFL